MKRKKIKLKRSKSELKHAERNRETDRLTDREREGDKKKYS